MDGLSWRRSGGVADLTRTTAFTLALLDDPWRWRQRVVEELELSSSEHVRVTSSFQLEFPPTFIAPFLDVSRARSARVLVPLVTREKRPLLGFEVAGPAKGPAHLIRRASIAAIASEYLGRLVASSPVRGSIGEGLPGRLLEAICVTTPTIYREFEANAAGRPQALATYLSDGLGFEVPAVDAERWAEAEVATARALTAALGEPTDPHSSSEHVLLALPRLEPRPGSIAEIDRLLDGYRRAVAAAEQAGDTALLRALAEYGRRFEMILELEAPLNEPFSVKVSEQRPLRLRARGWTTQRYGLRDASSFHFEARSTDLAVELADFRVTDLAGRPVGIPPLEGARYTREFLALSSSDPERPAAVEIGLRLRPTSDVRVTRTFVAALAWAAALAAALVPADESFGDVLNLLTIPTTFAVALVLLREETSLAARLQRSSRVSLLAAIGVLWTVEIVRLLLR